MNASHHRLPRTALLGALLCLLIALPAAAQVTFPRLGLSAAPDHYDPDIEVEGDETFQLHILVLGDTDGEPLEQDYGLFHWAVLEACCGGAAVIIDEEYNPACEHDGAPLSGVVTTAEECMGGDVVRLCTLTLQMTVDEPGIYYIIAGPLSLSQTCDQQGVVMTDMLVDIHYTPANSTPTEQSTWSEVKSLFRE
jgi:hypothetical protein